MPTYDYECTKCHHQFELNHGINDKPELSCPECEAAVKKVFAANGIIFKGSGWYITDSAPQPAATTPEK